MTRQHAATIGSKSYLWIFIASLVACSITPVRATVLMNADFDSTYNTGALVGQSGTSDVGLLGSFAAGASTANATVTNSTDLSYSVVGGGTISGGSHSVIVSNSAGTTQDVFNRALSSNVTGQTLYLRMVIDPLNNVNDSTFLRFYLTPTAPATTAMGGPGGGGLGLRGGGSSSLPAVGGTLNSVSATSGAGLLTMNQANLVVAAFNWNSTSNLYDSVSVWVNPTATALGTPTATNTLGASTFAPTSLSVIGLGIINFNATESIAVDSFVIGTQWTDVVTVPEPVTWLLLVGGLCALVIWRKRESLS